MRRKEAEMEDADHFSATQKDLDRLAELASNEYKEIECPDDFDECDADFLEGKSPLDPEETNENKQLFRDMLDAASSTTANNNEFFCFWCTNHDRIYSAVEEYVNLLETILLCFKVAIDGQVYYRKRLQEAIDGQKKARVQLQENQ